MTESRRGRRQPPFARRLPRRRFALAALMSALTAHAVSQPLADAVPPPRSIALWPQGAPGAHGSSLEDQPTLTAYLPAPARATGAGIVVFPGGGFTRRCEDHEGVLVAEWLRAHGIAAFLARYRVVPIGTLEDALADAHRAVRTVRTQAAGWGISPHRLGAIGFSAGGMLAEGVALRPLPADAAAADPVERVASRPDFLVLAYGATPPGPTADEVAKAPPTFLYGTAEDASMMRRTSDLYLRLLEAGRSPEGHFFAFGEHGTGLALGDPVLGSWPPLLHTWLRTSGFLSGQVRLALRGSVKVDGQPLPRGGVVLTPLGSTSEPAVIGYVFGTTEAAGEFALPAERGPTPGRYRVEVLEDATRWTSNSRDPVQLRLQKKLREGSALSAEDVAEWTAATRAKDFSPSLAGQRVFTRRKPGDAAEIVFDVRPGVENRLDLEVWSR
jgi:hypothetical protein